ncbi:ABC transporter ATP-binding protein [Spongisporangium articulatum]|uniref:ABC transporter ATP-binding protein n=1 Tax=Spongisporangium articulatum TaxID=3362603 RepID=A0ABW8AI93_9ACTN
MSEPLLDVRALNVSFPTRHGVARVVLDLDLTVERGETLAVVGESGSGKSVTMLAVAGLLPSPPARITGEAWFDGVQLIGASDDELRSVRGARIGMVFQDPMTSLNPYLRVGRQVTEGLVEHQGLSKREAADRAVELLDLVGIPEPARRARDYPHEFSGGMRQRVMIATALACDPDLLIADEATTALDVTTQAQIVDLVASLQDRLGMAVIWISHDLGVVARIADRVAVMYAGQVVEQAPVDELFAHPRHPYTLGLLQSLPVVETAGADLPTIEGLPPDPRHRPPGCAFHPRCPYRLDARCATEVPPLREVAAGHWSRSFYEVPDA